MDQKIHFRSRPTFSERAGLSTEIVEVAIASLQPQKLVSNDTLEGGTYYSAFGWSLRHASDIQINIVNRGVHRLEFLYDLYEKKS